MGQGTVTRQTSWRASTALSARHRLLAPAGCLTQPRDPREVCPTRIPVLQRPTLQEEDPGLRRARPQRTQPLERAAGWKSRLAGRKGEGPLEGAAAAARGGRGLARAGRRTRYKRRGSRSPVLSGRRQRHAWGLRGVSGFAAPAARALPGGPEEAPAGARRVERRGSGAGAVAPVAPRAGVALPFRAGRGLEDVTFLGALGHLFPFWKVGDCREAVGATAPGWRGAGTPVSSGSQAEWLLVLRPVPPRPDLPCPHSS